MHTRSSSALKGDRERVCSAQGGQAGAMRSVVVSKESLTVRYVSCLEDFRGIHGLTFIVVLVIETNHVLIDFERFLGMF